MLVEKDQVQIYYRQFVTGADKIYIKIDVDEKKMKVFRLLKERYET